MSKNTKKSKAIKKTKESLLSGYKIPPSLEERLEDLCLMEECIIEKLQKNLYPQAPLIHSVNIDHSKLFSDMRLDSSLHPNTAKIFLEGINERIDRKKANIQNKEYTNLWTTRVSLYWFSERFFRHVTKDLSKESLSLLEFLESQLNDLDSGSIGYKLNTDNPFNNWKHALGPVLDAWQPLINKMVSGYVYNTRNGTNASDDLKSVASIAFLTALEKHCMHVISLPRLAQRLPFSNRLIAAIQKAVGAHIPDLVGPVRLPQHKRTEKSDTKLMPTAVSFESIFNNEDN